MKLPPKYAGAILALVILFGGGSFLLGWSPVFTVRSVAISGAPTQESELAVARALEISKGDKLARLDPRALSNRLRSFDWIDNSQVSRNWISGKISISIQTRTPIALYSQPGKQLKLP